ncbi:MAG: metallophosphoesterase family protein [Deltaproteobacteria bacterium]|nr:metallophosphoesterase family protein [Deltaproteobacteria bacterium]
MSTIALISDVHSNVAALEAVLRHIDNLGVETVISLGDTVGYGPEPVECWLRVKEVAAHHMLGNHEFAAMRTDAVFGANPVAQSALEYTRAQLQAAGLIDELKQLPVSHQLGDTLFVHGHVREPFAYLRESDHRGHSQFDEVVSSLERDFQNFRVCFVGHNHKPFLATEEGFIHPHASLNRFCVADNKLYISVGSVGQPRDGDPRACFATFDGEFVEFHRVEYPIHITAEKITGAGLDARLARRLYRGH